MTYQNSYRYVTARLYQSGSTPNPIIAELPFTQVSFTQQLNSIGTFQGSLMISGFNAQNYNVDQGTTPGWTALYVFHNADIVWTGIIWSRTYDSETQTLQVTAQETMSYFTRRRITVDKDYTAGYDPQYIAKNLLDWAQSVSHGNIGLQIDSYSASSFTTKRFFNGYEYKGVYQAIKDLSNGCFDFRTYGKLDTTTGNIQTHFQMGSPIVGKNYASNATGINFQFPGNLVSYRFPEDGISAANTLYGLGYGANNTRVIATAIDPAKIQGSGDWPLLEDTVNYLDVGSLQLVQDLTLGKLNAISYPPTTVQVVLPTYVDPVYKPDYNYSSSTNYGYMIGDIARLFIKDDRFPGTFDYNYTIVAVDVQPGENGPDRVTVTLTQPLASGMVS